MSAASEHDDGESIAPPAVKRQALGDLDIKNMKDEDLEQLGESSDKDVRAAAWGEVRRRMKAKRVGDRLIVYLSMPVKSSVSTGSAAPTGTPLSAATSVVIKPLVDEAAALRGISKHPQEDQVCTRVARRLADLMAARPLPHALEVAAVQPFVQRLLTIIDESARQAGVTPNKAYREYAGTDEAGKRPEWVFGLPHEQRIFSENACWYLEAKTREHRGSDGKVRMSEEALLRQGATQIMQRLVRRFVITGGRTPHGIGAVINGAVVEFARLDFSDVNVPWFTTGPLPLFPDASGDGMSMSAAASSDSTGASGGSAGADACGGAGTASAPARAAPDGAMPSAGMPATVTHGLRLLIRLILEHSSAAFGVPEQPRFRLQRVVSTPPAASASAAASGAPMDIADLRFDAIIGQGGFGVVARYVRTQAAAHAAGLSAGAGASAGADALGSTSGALEGAKEFALKYAPVEQNREFVLKEGKLLYRLAAAGVPRVPKLEAEVASPECGPGLLLSPVGQPFLEFLAAWAGPPVSLAARLWEQLHATLQAAHSHNITHGDVRPTNVIVVRKQPSATSAGAAQAIASPATMALAPLAAVGGSGAASASATADFPPTAASGSGAVSLSDVDFVLIDWGLGSCAVADVPAGRKHAFGVPAFMADAVASLLTGRNDSTTERWELKAAHDMEALKYTCAAVVAHVRAEPPWLKADTAAMIEERSDRIAKNMPLRSDGTPDWDAIMALRASADPAADASTAASAPMEPSAAAAAGASSNE